jgi:hypothetical protein
MSPDRAGAPADILDDEGAIERLAHALHEKMEQLDPTEDYDWATLTERRREFYRLLIKNLLQRLGVVDGSSISPATIQ